MFFLQLWTLYVSWSLLQNFTLMALCYGFTIWQISNQFHGIDNDDFGRVGISIPAWPKGLKHGSGLYSITW